MTNKVFMQKLSFLLVVVLLISNCSFGQENYKSIHNVSDAENTRFYKPVNINSNRSKPSLKPKNIILLIGDGMGTAQIYAGYTANKGQLNIMSMPYSGFSITYSADNYITDSAAGGTALSSGVKTKNGAIGMDAYGLRVETILELAERQGKATGLIATSAITHATPASFIAHVASRAEYEEIAKYFLQTPIDLFIGGGRKHFEERADKRNLSNELKEHGYQVAHSLEEGLKINSLPLAVFTAEEHNPKYPQRGDMLPQATQKAIDLLSKNSNGFFMMVEGSQIDWGGHQNDAGYLVDELLDFDRAVGIALEFAQKNENTLVIVTADHETGGLALTAGDMEKGQVTGSFSTGNHSSVMVPVFAFGPGAEEFTGAYQNTEIYKMMASFINSYRQQRRK